MHFFTEPSLLVAQTAADAFAPQDDNVYNISSRHLVSAKAKAFACQDAMMIVLPYFDIGAAAIDTALVNIVLKPLASLGIRFSPVRYYIYRGIEKASLIDAAGNIVPEATAGKTEFITKFWTNWTTFATDTGTPLAPPPSPKSFGFDPALADTVLLEEIFNSAFSNDTSINELQAIKVSEGEWIGNILNTTNFEFEIITDVDHIDLNLGYMNKSKQVVDATGHLIDPQFPDLDDIALREKILNYIDPAAFFGMHFSVGVYLASWTGTTKNPSILKKEADLVNDILSKFHNSNVVYLDIRSEKGYSYYYYQNYRVDTFSGVSLTAAEVLKLMSSSQASFNTMDYIHVVWPLINLNNPPAGLTAIVGGDRILLKLLVKDNEKPLLFLENPSLLGAANVNNFIEETNLIDTTAVTDYTQTVSLEIPKIVVGASTNNVAHHIQLQYFRQADSALSPVGVLKAPKFLDAAFGGIKMPALDIPTPFQHLVNTKRVFVNGGTFSYVAENGAYQDDNLILFYADNVFSLKKSGNSYPQIDLTNTTANPITENPLLRKDTVYNKWRINDGVSDIDVLEIVGYNKLAQQATPMEDLLFLGMTKVEHSTLVGLAGLSDLHHKYFFFTEILDGAGLPLKDAVTQTPYRKFKLSVQGLDASGDVQTVTTSVPLIDIEVYGTSLNMLCTKDFAAAAAIPVLLPDPGIFTEFQDVYRHDYDANDDTVDALFPTGVISIPDNSMTWDAVPGAIVVRTAGLTGELFYPVDSPGSDTLSSRYAKYPMIVIDHANGGRYSNYRELATHLAKNGFIVTSLSGFYTNLLQARLHHFPTPLAAFPPITFNRAYTADYYVAWEGLDSFYVYYNNSVAAPINSNYAFEHLTVIQFTYAHPDITVTDEYLLSWKKGVDFDIYVTPTPFSWTREGGKAGKGLSKFGLSWTANVSAGPGFAAVLKKVGTRLVELTAVEWALTAHDDIKAAIDGAADLAEYEVPFPDAAIGVYLGTIMNDVYYMLKVDASTSTPCPAGTCVGITGEVKSGQLKLNIDVGQQGMCILGRANLVYPHLQIARKHMLDKFGDVFENRIGLIGHSRGAEAVVRCATDFPGIPSYDIHTFDPLADPRPGADKWKFVPDDLNELDAVISLAPTDASGDQREQISVDVPYFVLYGSMEGDVTGDPDPIGPNKNRTSGFSIYDRSDNTTEKSMAFVYGATHNGFITNNMDYPNPARGLTAHVGNVIDATIQRRTSRAYMNAFMRIHLKDENIWRPIFYGDYIPQSIMHPEIYSQFKDMEKPIPPVKWINDFEAAAGSVTLNGVAPAAGSALEWGDLVDMDGNTPHDTKGIKVRWTASDVLTFTVAAGGKNVTAYDYVSFRICHVRHVSAVYKSLISLKVKINDTGAGTFERVIDKVIPDPHLREAPLTKSAMVTVRLKLDEFVGVDMNIVKELILTFPPTAPAAGEANEVLIDDVEFTN
jgi:hypothetical protein